MHTFLLQTSLAPHAAIQAIETLLIKRSVTVAHGADASLESTSIALPSLGTDRRLYSRDNWIGVNPFIYLSALAVVASTDRDGQTSVVVTVSLFRFWIGACVFASFVLPGLLLNPGAGILGLAIVAVVTSLGRALVIGRALPAELRKALKVHSDRSLETDGAKAGAAS